MLEFRDQWLHSVTLCAQACKLGEEVVDAIAEDPASADAPINALKPMLKRFSAKGVRTSTRACELAYAFVARHLIAGAEPRKLMHFFCRGRCWVRETHKETCVNAIVSPLIVASERR